MLLRDSEQSSQSCLALFPENAFLLQDPAAVACCCVGVVVVAACCCVACCCLLACHVVACCCCMMLLMTSCAMQEGLKLMRDNTVFECPGTGADSTRYPSAKATSVILGAGKSLDTLMLRYKGKSVHDVLHPFSPSHPVVSVVKSLNFSGHLINCDCTSDTCLPLEHVACKGTSLKPVSTGSAFSYISLSPFTQDCLTIHLMPQSDGLCSPSRPVVSVLKH